MTVTGNERILYLSAEEFTLAKWRDKMEMFHTSPVEITEIKKDGLFGECLFFSYKIYRMSSCRSVFTYKIDIDESDIVRAKSFFFRDDYEKLNDIVEHIMLLTDCDEDTAQEYLSGNEFTENSEYDWQIQKFMGDAAKVLGFKAVESSDEQGTVYIVPMLGREKELTKI